MLDAKDIHDTIGIVHCAPLVKCSKAEQALLRPWSERDTPQQRHEYYLAGRLGVKPGDKVLDCGCGIGGPYRNIANFSGANITGITINEYQVCI